jgi:hypothetical protein
MDATESQPRRKTVFRTTYVDAGAKHNHLGVVDGSGDGATSVDGDPPHRHRIFAGVIHTAANHNHERLVYADEEDAEETRESA